MVHDFTHDCTCNSSRCAYLQAARLVYDNCICAYFLKHFIPWGNQYKVFPGTGCRRNTRIYNCLYIADSA